MCQKNEIDVSNQKNNIKFVNYQNYPFFRDDFDFKHSL